MRCPVCLKFLGPDCGCDIGGALRENMNRISELRQQEPAMPDQKSAINGDRAALEYIAALSWTSTLKHAQEVARARLAAPLTEAAAALSRVTVEGLADILRDTAWRDFGMDIGSDDKLNDTAAALAQALVSYINGGKENG